MRDGLTGEFKRPQSTEAIAMFAALQAAIEALDRAIDDERKIEDERRETEGLKEMRERLAC